ncbi:MAG: sigma-70 family RNA polymerase sigma factor [Clostridiales bacterium]|jgi:DNA-directed RNA polymerase specialized sigma24 family protein|nr:sigma-70 family RNA polymerase sigma factor [Clostridiales bacterium]
MRGKAVMFICEKTEFDKIIDMYGKLIFSVCYGMTRDYFASEDLTQPLSSLLFREKSVFPDN